MKSLHMLSITVVVALSLFAGRASGQVVIDQVADAGAAGSTGGPNIDNVHTPMQTFTVGVAGTLAVVELQLQQGFSPPSDDLVLSILGTLPDGTPDFATNLGSVSVPAATFPDVDLFNPQFTAIDVLSLNIAVSPGDMLTIAPSYPTGTGNYFMFHALDFYAGGVSYIVFAPDNFFESPHDLGFRTTVLIPEPASMTLLGAAALFAVRRHRSTNTNRNH